MFPIILDNLYNYEFLFEKNILFFSCISFEKRSKTAAKKIFNVNRNIVWGFFQLIDNGSHFEKECTEKQNENIKEITELIDINLKDIPEYNLFDSQPWECIITYFKSIIKKNPDLKIIILDITTIPKICYFPFLKWLLDEGLANMDLIICYTKPEEYSDSKQESDPINPSLLIGDYKKGKDILWIPSLGFKSTFTLKILEKIRESDKGIEKKILPLIGFPAYRPDYFDKVLISHIKEGDPELNKSLMNPILAASDNPFDVYYQLKEIINNNIDKNIILSPLGPKPMSIGLAICAIQYNLPIYAIQARTYHPDYSIGEGISWCYWIKREGEYTF